MRLHKLWKTALCLLLSLVLALPALAAPAEDYTGKTVILWSGNLRGDVDAYARLAAAKTAYAEMGAMVYLFDAGNYLQGSAAANTDRGAGIYSLMDAAGYDAAAMGLAEFGYTDATTGMIYHGNLTRYYTQAMLQNGTEEIVYNKNRDGSETGTLAARDPARFQALAWNVTASDSYAFVPSVLLGAQEGITLGVYGLTDPGVIDCVQDGFISAIAPAAPVELEGADVTVCLSNAPVDASFGDIVIDVSDSVAACGVYVIDTDGSITEQPLPEGEDATVAALAAQIKDAAADVLFTSDVILNGADSVNWCQESNLGDLTADALLWYAQNHIDGLDSSLPLVAIQNGGNCDQFLYTGDITEIDLLRALPFSPMGVGVLYIQGSQLLEALEAGTSPSERYGEQMCPGFAQVSGLRYTVNWGNAYEGIEPYGNYHRVHSVSRVQIDDIQGASFDPDAMVAVVADNFLLGGNDTYYVFSEAREAGNTYLNNGNGVKTRDIVARYVSEMLQGHIGKAYAAPQGRIQTTTGHVFADVPVDAYYAPAVAWAYENAITTGRSDTTFDPQGTVTRGEAVAFLWRASGEPEVSGVDNPFQDVSESDFYYEAVLWAISEGITLGTAPDTFSPKDPVQREQMITFQWRAAGRPGAAADTDGEPYYAPAIAWAESLSLLEGTDVPFAVKDPCPRCDVVTYLYRAMA